MIRNARTVCLSAAAALALGISLAVAAQQSGSPAVTKAVAVSSAGNLAVEHYVIDTTHSSVVFRIEHLGVSPFYGRFNEISGSYDYDPDNPENSSFDLTVKTASVDTNNGRRDGHLKSPDFFNAAEYPEITFESTKVQSTGDGTLRVTGNLSLHGETKSITTDVTLIGRKETQQGFKSGFGTEFTIKRTDFGMDTFVASGGLGDEVTLMIGLEGARQ